MKRSVMIVDDSRVVFSTMQKMLEGTEIEVAGFCRSGEEALEKYGEIRPDLVTLDIVMPGMDGLETCRELIAKWPDARILMVSSLAYDDTMKTASDLGAKGFIYKPFDQRALLEGILKAFDS